VNAKESLMLQLEQNLNRQHAAQCVQLGQDAIARGIAQFNFSDVTLVDSSAIAIMLAWQRAANQAQLPLQFIAVPNKLISLLNLYGVADLFHIESHHHH
jgi:phospholipid transport system transporter-binding protein